MRAKTMHNRALSKTTSFHILIYIYIYAFLAFFFEMK